MGLLFVFFIFAIAAPHAEAVFTAYDSVGGANLISTAAGTNFVSQGFECCAVSQFGNAVVLTAVAPLVAVDVMLSSWACQTGGWSTNDCQTTPGSTFPVAIELKLYDNTNAPSAALLWSSGPVTFAIPYRPSRDTSGTCTTGRWLNAASGTCYNGLAHLISFTVPAVLPPSNTVLWTVSYNTRTQGFAPTGVASGADSLNVAEESIAAPYVGLNQFATTNYIYGSSATAYCDTTGVFNTLRLDLDAPGGGCLCTGGSCYTPMARFTALDIVAPTE